MTEFEKMRSGQLYNFDNTELLSLVARANELCARFSNMTVNSPGFRQLLGEIVPGIPESSTINPPFHCDYGSGIKIGEHTFINYDAVILDGGLVTIGSHCKIGPRCQFYTPQHPIDYKEREKPQETCHPITIGDNCWLGGGVIVCPGVTIGPRCIIGAGSVVTRDIPADSLAAGNPAVVKRSLK